MIKREVLIQTMNEDKVEIVDAKKDLSHTALLRLGRLQDGTYLYAIQYTHFHTHADFRTKPSLRSKRTCFANLQWRWRAAFQQ